MPTYVSLINWTEQGVRDFRESTKRAEDFTKLVEAQGGKVRELVWTVGEYDIVSVVEFPDEESGVATLLQVGSLGNIRSNTLRAFSAREMDSIVERTRSRLRASNALAASALVTRHGEGTPTLGGVSSRAPRGVANDAPRPSKNVGMTWRGASWTDRGSA